VAPTETYTQLGVELLQGDNSFIPYEGSGGSHTTNAGDEIRSSFSSVSGPRLITAFAKFGPDLGPDHAAQFGISGGYARTWQQETEHGSGLEEWDGDAWFAGLDAVYKYSSGRAYGHGDWRVQGEYFYREIDVDYQRRQDQATIADNAVGSSKAKQDGLYLQAVYGFAPRWEAGVRTEALGLTNDGLPGNERDAERVRQFVTPDFDTSYRHTAQVTFRPVEPVFLRAQLSQNDFVDDDGDRDRGLEFMLQLNVALGAHGAHRF
ncbi:MAG: zinc-regulated TonB-dependent outer membrane receptor, partial [Thioalkalivibrio sp.]